MSAFLKIDLITDFAALCLTDFIDWRNIHSVVCIFDPACELLSPWTKKLYLCTVAPLLYSTFSLTSSPLPPLPSLFLTRFKDYKIATPPQIKMTSKGDIKGFVSLKFLRLWLVERLSKLQCQKGMAQNLEQRSTSVYYSM
jgi:hypothetical protein